MIQILGRQESFLTPRAHAPSIGLDIMQGEDGEDVLPLADFGRDAGAALFWGNDDHMVDNAQAFGFGLGLNRAGRFGFGAADTVEPVTNAGHIESQPNPRAPTGSKLTATGAGPVRRSSPTREQTQAEMIYLPVSPRSAIRPRPASGGAVRAAPLLWTSLGS